MAQIEPLGQIWSYEDLKFVGLSLSGIRTSIALPNFGICFDVAQGLPFNLNLKKYFISHGHLDHAAGIPYIISQKAMHNEPTPDFYMPESLVQPMTDIMHIWEGIEKHQYRFQFHAINASSEIEINPNLTVRPFSTVHRVDSFGYSLVQKNKKLKSEYRSLHQAEIQKMKAQGTPVDEWTEKILVSFTGDTEIGFLDRSPQVKKSKILILETTYLDDRKSIEHAKKWGHTHLDELIPRLDEIESEQIVLIHVSSRYSTREALEILAKKIPKKYQERMTLYPGR